MKLRKILLPIASVTLVATPLCAMTSCNHAVKVTGIEITSLPATYLGETPKTMKFTAEVTPSSATNKNVKWSIVESTEPEAGEATIDETTGVLTPSKAGTVIVKATAADGSGITKQTGIKIYENPVEIVYAYANNNNAKIGDTIQLNTYVYPESACKDLKWDISDTNLASITSDGKLTMKNEGIVQVSCTTQDGTELTSSIEIKGYTTPATSVTFTKYPTDKKIGVGEEFQLVASVNSEASIKDVTWEIEDTEGKASIDPNGYIVGAKDGKVTVTATSADCAASEKLEITVDSSKTVTPISAEEYISNRSFSIEAGEYDSTGQYASAEFGTGWIVADATTEILDDYRFLIAIPRTLQNRFNAKEEYAKKQGHNFVYRFSSKNAKDTSNINQWSDYIEFTSYEPISPSITSYLGGDVPMFKVGNVDYTKGIDMQLVYVSFSSATTNKSNAIAASALRKLNKLNALSKAEEKITKLAHFNSDGTVNEGKEETSSKKALTDLKVYTGGYPQQWKDQKPDYNNWEYDLITFKSEVEAGEYMLTYQLNDAKAAQAEVDPTKDDGTYHLFDKIADVAPYFYSTANGVRMLNTNGGAGSMIVVNLGDDTTPNYQVLGMYWGTSTQRKPYTSDPHFSILNSFQKYYLEDIIDPE